jgi:hypothetical protein
MENMYDFKNKMKYFFLLCVFRILTEAVVVDFRYRTLAFCVAGSEPPRLRLRGLTCPAISAGVERLQRESTY